MIDLDKYWEKHINFLSNSAHINFLAKNKDSSSAPFNQIFYKHGFDVSVYAQIFWNYANTTDKNFLELFPNKTEEDIQRLLVALSYLHDIGKLAESNQQLICNNKVTPTHPFASVVVLSNLSNISTQELSATNLPSWLELIYMHHGWLSEKFEASLSAYSHSDKISNLFALSKEAVEYIRTYYRTYIEDLQNLAQDLDLWQELVLLNILILADNIASNLEQYKLPTEFQSATDYQTYLQQQPDYNFYDFAYVYRVLHNSMEQDTRSIMQYCKDNDITKLETLRKLGYQFCAKELELAL
jgi:CRISPR-associated endonuclease Cas3-HD